MSETPGPDSFLEGLPLPRGHWPTTLWNLVKEARDSSPEARKATIDRLLRLYYAPVYRFFERVLGIPTQDAREVTQDFFTRFIEKDFLKAVIQEKSFRNFLKVACRRHAINWWKAAARDRVVALDSARDLEDPSGISRVAAAIDAELRAWILEEALARTRKELATKGKDDYFKLLEERVRLDGQKPKGYGTLAKELGQSLYDVRNHLSMARKVLRRLLLQVAGERLGNPEVELAELGLAEYL